MTPRLVLAALGFLVGVFASDPLGAQVPQPSPATLGDPKFQRSFELYWRARFQARLAGNRVCALPNNHYDDPKSPYRPLDDRLIKAGQIFDERYPHALNALRRPYMMPPPQSLCDDAPAAQQALREFAETLDALEAALAK